MRYCAILIRLLGPMVALALCLAPSAARAAQDPAADAADAAFVAQGEDLLETSVYAIQSSGNVILATYPEDMLARFELGDIVSVSMGDKAIEVPVVGAFADVDSGMAALVVQVDKGACRLAIYMGSFAEAHGITPETVFQIALKEKGGYADELIMRGLAYTDERSDYPGLTDEQFANFRAVTTTGMGDGVLFRSASPVNPRHNRSAYADAAMRKAGVSVALNLVDDEDDLADFEGYADSYYASVDHIARAMSVDFTSAANKAALAEELRFLAERPGTYVIHCLEGKDRSGFVVSLLECLMGASRDAAGLHRGG